MISLVSKAFFIPADPLSPFLSFFVITNSGKSQSAHAAAPACCGGQRGGWFVGLGWPFWPVIWGPMPLGSAGFEVKERMNKGSIMLKWCCADIALFRPRWSFLLGCPGSG